MRPLRAFALLLLALIARPNAAAPPPAAAEAVLGRWIAYEASSDTSSVIELYLEQGLLAGRVIEVRDASGLRIAPRCERCPEPLAGSPISGLRFLWGLRAEDGRWVDGRVLDLRPGLSQGVEANAELQLLNGELRLHAYLGLPALGQTRVWRRP
ncbi:DUF2147 domain-containing protein [Stagnimonas aquatica]|uniref:DUF2147 domain-containing protein n=1 Tax=Stagnimonas aquatica TaxID=2689987 RepID=A0A3N0VLX0_9GAMM|nr:DUF2147 domain-containing protein [Stagnimonas aquatica]ROH93721.1 DUF2147 domain-containing protein [Stagnimonas aquatica]